MQQLPRYCTSLLFVLGKYILYFHSHLLSVFGLFICCFFLVSSLFCHLLFPFPLYYVSLFVLCLYLKTLVISCDIQYREI
jgi:hypothetical protein